MEGLRPSWFPFLPSDPNILRGLGDSTGTSAACSWPPFFMSYHTNGVHALLRGETQKINYWASTLSLLWPPLVEIRRFWGAGILDFAPASSARVTPLASLQLPMLLTYTLFLLLSCVVRDRKRVPAGSWSWGSTLFFSSAHILDWARISEAPQLGQARG